LNINIVHKVRLHKSLTAKVKNDKITGKSKKGNSIKTQKNYIENTKI